MPPIFNICKCIISKDEKSTKNEMLFTKKLGKFQACLDITALFKRYPEIFVSHWKLASTL
jgi:hypothetical protein